MDESNNPPSGGTAEPLTFRGAVNQLTEGRNKQQDTPSPAPGAVPSPVDDAPDPADLAALDQVEGSETEPTEPVQSEQPHKLRLKDGTEATFDEIEDWRKGTLRQSDYTKKTQELADQRRQFEAQFSQFQEQSKSHSQVIDNAIAIARHFLPPAPSDELRKQDFFAWQEQTAEHQSQLGKIQQLLQHKAQFEQAEAQKAQAAQASWMQEQAERLNARLPDLKDPVKATKWWEEAKRLGASEGFKHEEMSNISDARIFGILDKAMKYDRLMAHKAKLAEKAKNAEPMRPPVQEPGRRQSNAERTNASLKPLAEAFDKATSAQSQMRAAAALLTAQRAAAARR